MGHFCGQTTEQKSSLQELSEETLKVVSTVSSLLLVKRVVFMFVLGFYTVGTAAIIAISFPCIFSYVENSICAAYDRTF